mgnify:CR=1 FL=1
MIKVIKANAGCVDEIVMVLTEMALVVILALKFQRELSEITHIAIPHIRNCYHFVVEKRHCQFPSQI